MQFSHKSTKAPDRTLHAVLILSLPILAAVCAPGSAAAATFTVDNTTVDQGDLHPGDGKCEWSTSVPVGQRCTLRAALPEAHTLARADPLIMPFEAPCLLSRPHRP